MFGIKWSELFPNSCSLIVFSLYILLFVFHGVFVTASMKVGGGYDYNITLVIILSECLKLVASAVLYSYNKRNKTPLLRAIKENYKLMLLYFIPSLLYCFYNNLAFVNLAHYDPTTYYLLLQFRVVITAVLFQALFSKKLTLQQWLSLLVLTFGCIIKNVSTVNLSSNSSVASQIFSYYTILIIIQNFCSCLAGTYNEYLLKTKGADVDIFLQNVFMYLDSIICNTFIIIFTKDVRDVFTDASLDALKNVFVILIIVNNAIVGIVTSFFLKNLNSILKTFASALELIITAVVCYIIFGIAITWSTVIAILLVSFAVIVYFKNPVNNTIPSGKVKKDEEHLLNDVAKV